MRLEILDTGYSFGIKILFSLIGLFSRHPVPDAAKLVFYRPDFYGAVKFTHEAMRGPSEWSVADRELIAAYISKVNECQFCIGAHSATASIAYKNEARVSAVLSNLEIAPIEEPLRAILRMLGKLTREQAVNADDMRKVLDAGVTRAEIADALAVCCAFNITNRLADAFGFEMMTPTGFAAGANYLLRRG